MSVQEGLNTTDPTRIVAHKKYNFVINDTGSATVVGHLLCFATTTAGLGKSGIQPVTAVLSSFAGVCRDAVEDGEVVKMQTEGYCPKVSVLGHADMTQGDVLVPANTADHAVYSKAADGLPGFIVAIETYTDTDTAADKACLLYCGY